jgi:hypothetical protein
LISNVTKATQRLTGPKRPAIHLLAGDFGVNEPDLRQALHKRGILTVGIPKTISPINPKASPKEVLSVLNKAGLNRQRTPHQVQLACAYSRPVVESQPHCQFSLTGSQAKQSSELLRPFRQSLLTDSRHAFHYPSNIHQMKTKLIAIRDRPTS